MFHYRNCVRPTGQTLALLLLPGLALLPGGAHAALDLDGAILIALDNDPASAASRAAKGTLLLTGHIGAADAAERQERRQEMKTAFL